jgi:hypothetical protein
VGGGFRIENVLLLESEIAQFQKGEDLQPERVVVRDAE